MLAWGVRYAGLSVIPDPFKTDLTFSPLHVETMHKIDDAISQKHAIDVSYQGLLDQDPVTRSFIPTGWMLTNKNQPYVRVFDPHDPEGAKYKSIAIHRIQRFIGSAPHNVTLPEDMEISPTGELQMGAPSSERPARQPNSRPVRPLSTPEGIAEQQAPVTPAGPFYEERAQSAQPIVERGAWTEPVKCRCGGYTEKRHGKCTTCGAQVRVKGVSRPGIAPAPSATPAPERATFNSEQSIPQHAVDASGFYSERSDGGSSDGPEITPEEYEEIRSLDINPQTHDKATVKRLRSMGASHLDIKNACERKIPIEDYEMALKNTGDHVKAIDEALSYQDSYRDAIAANQRYLRDNPSASTKTKEGQKPLLLKENYSSELKFLFQHHRSLRDADSFDDPRYPDVPGRRRANEWIMNECAKLDPSLKEHIKIKLNRPEYIMRAGNIGDQNVPSEAREQGYADRIHRLLWHHNRRLLNASTIEQYVTHKRAIHALVNMGHSHYYPSAYYPDIYEEE